MKFCTALFFSLLFFGCIDRLQAPDGNEEISKLPREQEPESSESSNLVTKTEDVHQSESSDDTTILADQAPSSVSSSASELEEIVTPTVAPATPTYDTHSVESSSATNTVSSSSVVSPSQEIDSAPASVILIPPHNPAQVQSSESVHVAEDEVFSDTVPTQAPQVLSSVLDTNPQVPISAEPTPTPPTVAATKDEEDSITAALNQADEESKPKEEEMPSFDEFKRKILQEEEEKSKQQSVQNSSGTLQKPKAKKIKERKQSNYASVDCGAKVLDSNAEASNADSILAENKDLYMLNPCSAKIWFIVELCDLAQVKSIQIANFELFSSTPESFRVYVSQRYPTREWTLLGTFQAREEREIQSFPLDEPIYAKYAKVEMLSHFGSEHYCPLSLLRVYGSSMMEELEDHETDGQDDSDNPDSDSDDVIQVLPSEPGAATKEEPRGQNIFERAKDTVISFVKKLTGSEEEKENGTLNSSDASGEVASEKTDQSKQSIVTLMGEEEVEEKLVVTVSDKGAVLSPDRSDSSEKSKAVSKSVEDSSLCEETEDELNSETSTALTTCQLFARVIGHSSLGCLMGRALFSKKQQPKSTALEGNEFRKSKTVKGTGHNKSHVSREEEKENIPETNGRVEKKDNSEQVVTIEEKPAVIKSKEEEIHVASSVEDLVKPEVTTPKPSSSSVEETSVVLVTVTPSDVVHVETVKVSSIIVQPSHSVENALTSSGKSADQTPSLPGVSVVTSRPGNSTQSLSSSIASQNSEIPVVEESNVNIQDVENLQPSIEIVQSIKEPVLKQPNSVSADLPVVVGEENPVESQDLTKQPVPSVLKDVPKEKEEREVKINTPDQLSEVAEGLVENQVSPSECKAPNSLAMVSQSSPDIDVLETKLTDREGREGLAELPEEEKPLVDVKDETSEQEQLPDLPSVKAEVVESESKETSSLVEQPESTIAHTAATSVVQVTQSSDLPINPAKSSTEAVDLADSILPLAAPPLVTDPATSSQEFPTSSDVSLDAASLSKVQQGAAASAGMAAVGGTGTHKESIFVRLSNKIKALEQNLTLSTLYMEQLNQRYRKSLDEMQKNLDKKVALLTNATKKAELVINGQKEHITKLQSKVDDLTMLVTDMKGRMDFLNKEVMERHIIGLCIEVILILVLFTIFRRRYYPQVAPDTPRGAVNLMNGHGPPRLANGGVDCTECAGTTLATASLSGREQLLRSFGKTPDPECVGAVMSTDVCNNKHQLKSEPCCPGESKKKRNRKRSKQSITPDPPLESPPSKDPPSPVSLMSRTAGLLFNARGLFGGLANPWKAKKPPTVGDHRSMSLTTEENYFGGAGTSKKAPSMTRAKSLDIVPEGTMSSNPPPPPPPPLPPQFGVVFKRPPDYYYSKKSNSQNITRGGPMKYGKYGVLDNQLA